MDAFDIAEVGVAKARQLAADHGVAVHYQVVDCDGFDWPQAAYDGVAAIFIQFADPPMRERLFARIVQSLKPGGTLILQGLHAAPASSTAPAAAHRLAPVHEALLRARSPTSRS